MVNRAWTQACRSKGSPFQRLLLQVPFAETLTLTVALVIDNEDNRRHGETIEVPLATPHVGVSREPRDTRALPSLHSVVTRIETEEAQPSTVEEPGVSGVERMAAPPAKS